MVFDVAMESVHHPWRWMPAESRLSLFSAGIKKLKIGPVKGPVWSKNWFPMDLGPIWCFPRIQTELSLLDKRDKVRGGWHGWHERWHEDWTLLISWNITVGEILGCEVDLPGFHDGDQARIGRWLARFYGEGWRYVMHAVRSEQIVNDMRPDLSSHTT